MHAVSGCYFRVHFWWTSRPYLNFPPTWNFFISLPSFQKARDYFIWSRNNRDMIVWAWMVINFHYHECYWFCAFCYHFLAAWPTSHTHFTFPLPLMIKPCAYIMYAHHASNWPNEEMFLLSIPSLSTLSQVSRVLTLFCTLSASKNDTKLTSMPSKT